MGRQECPRHGARGILAGRGDRVFQVQDDDVSAEIVCFAEFIVAVARYEHQ